MAKEREMVRTTKTVERLPASEGDPIAGKLRAAMKEYARLTIEGYTRAFWEVMEGDARLDVFKRAGGQFMKKGELAYGQTDPADVEAFVIATWGSGVYQLRPMVAGKYYGPVSLPYKLGEDSDAPERKEDGIEALVGQLAVAKQLKELRDGLLAGERKGDDEGMKATDVQAMIEATTRPLIAMSEAAERRAAAAEQRNHELQMKMMEMASGRQQGAQSSIAELVKMLPKEALGALLAPPDAPGWAERAIEALREFGPTLIQLIMSQFKPGVVVPGAGEHPALTEGAPTAVAGGPRPTETAESGGGNRAVPIQLNAEQLEAKKMLLECIRDRDFDNAYAMIENFPGFTPTVNGPMPIGAAFLSMVDPKVTRPRIYVIQMMQLVPELSSMLDAADAFVSYVQQRLMRDQEAYLKEQASRDTGPRPTRGEDESA